MVDGIAHVFSRGKEDAVDVLDLIDDFGFKLATFEAERIHTRIAQWKMCRLAKRGDIFADQGAALQNGMAADAHKLMYGTHAANDRKIIDGHVPSQIDCIGEDGMVADHTIVGHMRVGHHEDIVFEDGRSTLQGATVDGGILANRAIFPDDAGRFFSAKFEVLRNTGNHGTRENPSVFANSCAVIDDDVGADPAAFLDHDITLDRREGFDDDTICDLRIGMDMGQWILQLFGI